jgi:hypothetical protein
LHSHPQWKSCPACGCEFDVEDGPAVDPPSMLWLLQNRWPGATQAEADEDQRAHLEAQPQTEPQAPAATENISKCWSCTRPVPAGAEKCPNAACGAYQGDIPF